MTQARVLDARGRVLAPCPVKKARQMLADGRASLVSENPLTVRLGYAVDLPEPKPEPASLLMGQRLLLHACCAPCATWTVPHLTELGADVTGFWFNPNIHPFAEHERRRETLATYADEQGLSMVWEPGYEMPTFLQAVADDPQQGRRCRRCYHLRLQRTAQRAAELGYSFFSTTLLISPYQDLDAISEAGRDAAEAYGIRFYGENMRRGFAAHHRLAKEHHLYRQRYCGCLYSEWESLSPHATTRGRR